MTIDPIKAPEAAATGPDPEVPEAERPQAPQGAAAAGAAAAAGVGSAAAARAYATSAGRQPVPGGHEQTAADAGRPGPGPGPGPAVDFTQSAAGDPAPDEAVAAPGVDIAALAARAEKADEYLALAQRTQADFENYRKRALREAKAAQERGALKLVHSLLPAIDNLDRALAHMDTAAEPEAAAQALDNGTASFVTGIKHVHADVLAALGTIGVEAFDPVGEPFDPQYHEAVAQQPVEGAPPGTVVEVFQRGYRHGETVVRPARVVVAG